MLLDSVISRARADGGRPAADSRCRTRRDEVRPRELAGREVHADAQAGEPGIDPLRAAWRACSRAQFSSLKITGLRSTDAEELADRILVFVRVRQRSSASTLATRPSRAFTIGW